MAAPLQRRIGEAIILGGLLTGIFSGCQKPQPKPPDTPPPPAVAPDQSNAGPAAPPGSNNPATPSLSTSGPFGPSSSTPGAGAGGTVVYPGGGVGVTAPGTLPGGGGGGAIQAVRKAVRRTQALNELNTLGQIIEQMRDPFGKMPTRDQILAELQRSYPQLYQAVLEGSYILTGTSEGSGLWAYEVEADVRPGIALIGGRAVRTTPEELAPYLRR